MNNPVSYKDTEIVDPEEAELLRQFIAHPEPPPPHPDWLLDQLGMLALKPMKKLADVEASAIIQRDFKLLSGYPQADLGYAIGRLTRESKFYPEISDFIKLVEYPAAVRRMRRNQAETALMKHRHEWTPPIPEDQLCKPEDIARIKAEVEAEFAARNPNKEDEAA